MLALPCRRRLSHLAAANMCFKSCIIFIQVKKKTTEKTLLDGLSSTGNNQRTQARRLQKLDSAKHEAQISDFRHRALHSLDNGHFDCTYGAVEQSRRVGELVELSSFFLRSTRFIRFLKIFLIVTGVIIRSVVMLSSGPF
jgi:hypothetical protein